MLYLHSCTLAGSNVSLGALCHNGCLAWLMQPGCCSSYLWPYSADDACCLTLADYELTPACQAAALLGNTVG